MDAKTAPQGVTIAREFTAEKVEHHGVLWLLDRMFEDHKVRAKALHGGLTKIAAHPRCRLPRHEIRERLERYAQAAERTK